jgi:hypothetical protein
MGAGQFSFFQQRLKDFVESNERTFYQKEFLEKSFIEALRRLYAFCIKSPEEYKTGWKKHLKDSIKDIRKYRKEFLDFFMLLKTQTSVFTLNKNPIFQLVLSKCREDIQFSFSCMDWSTSNWSEQNVNIFFDCVLDVLFQKSNQILNWSNIWIPDLLDSDFFHRKLLEGSSPNTEVFDQEYPLIFLLEVTIGDSYAYQSQSRSLFTKDGIPVDVKPWFHKDLNEEWIFMVKTLRENALS